MPILIGLNGIKGSGKNTVAKYIAQWGDKYGLITGERGFADLLKLSAMRSFGMTTNMNDALVYANELKENGVITIEIPGLTVLREISGREYLKWFGTEGHRDVFGTDFWIDQVLPPHGRWAYSFVTVDDQVPDICVITDLRFANEARRVHALYGVVWNVNRGLPPDADGHMSEQPLPDGMVDVTIPNHDSLEALETEVIELMTSKYHSTFVHRA